VRAAPASRHRAGDLGDILREFAKHDDIELAYITRRGFNNVTEGKPGARAGELPGRVDAERSPLMGGS